MRRMNTGWKSVGSTSVGIAAALLAGAAQAEVRISDNPTRNMSCSAHACSPTANKAVLNVAELANMLAAADTMVTTGSGAKDIVVRAALSWTSASRLTLYAYRTVEIAKAVAVAGDGALEIGTNQGDRRGEFIIDPKASVQFWSLSRDLVINGNAYTLVSDIHTLAADIAANPSGFYALAKPYDASADGTYSSSPIGTLFQGTLEGLGNKISALAINSAIRGDLVAFLAALGSGGTLRDLGLVRANLFASQANGISVLVGNNYGRIERCWASGQIAFPVTVDVGGLVSENDGSIKNSFADVEIMGSGAREFVGGLVGYNYSTGDIESSYSIRSAAVRNGSELELGGLAGESLGAIQNSFARANVIGKKGTDSSDFGGLLGRNASGGHITTSYAAGQMKGFGGNVAGGLVGFDEAVPGNINHSYWDLEKGISDPSRGAGNTQNDPGITGLTTAQLQAGLPNGFDPTIWGENPNVNDGFPYLLEVTPKK